MLSWFKKGSSIVSPLTGSAVLVSDVPDPVFSDKILGDGVGIEPSNGKVVAPVKGTIAQIAHTFHAIGIESEDGLEVLVHLGIDTVKLDGKGFTCHVKVGDKVEVGDHLMDMDIDFIKAEGYKTISPCIITNMDAIKDFQSVTGDVKAGETAVITYKSNR